MALSISYGFDFVRDLSPPFLSQFGIDAASLSDGGVAFSGNQKGQTSATVIDVRGDPIGGVIEDPVGINAALSQLSNGNIAIAADHGTDVFFTIINQAGLAIVSPTGIGEAGSDVLNADVAGGLAGGRFVIAYQKDNGGGDVDIKLEIRNNDGSHFTNFATDTFAHFEEKPSVAVLNDGGFALAWDRVEGGSTEILYGVYNADGSVRAVRNFLDTDGTINRNASVVALDNGGFAIAYEDNGDTGGETDITLARFNAAGARLGFDNISLSLGNDTAPSTTVLSNGMILVGSTNDVFGDTDPIWTLVDPNTGDWLGSTRTGATLSNDDETAVAAMTEGRVAAYFTGGDAHEVIGQMLQASRTSIGDAAADTITGDDLVDIVDGGAGDDTIRGGLNADHLFGGAGYDTFTYATGEAGRGEIIDGGADRDQILALSSVSFVDASLASIETVEFSPFSSGPTTMTFRADQIGAGLAATLNVDGVIAGGVADTLRILMLNATSVDLSGLGFVAFDSGPSGNDRIVVTGDGSAETIIGTSLADQISGNGGNDVLTGRGGIDVLLGGAGDDIYVVNAAGEAIESIGQGTDTVRASVTYGLGLNLENLVLLGSHDIGGTGNGLGNVITGNDGNNSLSGLAGNDTLKGGEGDDTLNGGAGTDTADYSDKTAAVRVTLAGPKEAVVTVGGIAEDSLFDIENVRGGAGADTLIGDGSANALTGNGGDDRLAGGIGDDILRGGLGADSLNGGAGDDRFIYGALADSEVGAGLRDEIRGFASGDRIDVSLIDAVAGGADNAFVLDAGGSFSAGEIHQTVFGGDLILDFNTDGDPASEMQLILIARATLLTDVDFVL